MTYSQFTRRASTRKFLAYNTSNHKTFYFSSHKTANYFFAVYPPAKNSPTFTAIFSGEFWCNPNSLCKLRNGVYKMEEVMEY